MVDEKFKSTTFLSVRGLTKSFFGNVVLNNVSLDIEPNDFHALVGENGAGKSTLINLLSGLLIPDTGTITIQGEVSQSMTPVLAAQKGISVVHQELSLFPHLSVVENIFQGREITGAFGLLNKQKMKVIAQDLLKDIGIGNIDIQMPVYKLSLAEQQMIEFVKALYQKPKLLILDEATSALDPEQVKTIFKHLRKRRDEMGLSIIFISHRLGEVYELCDTITVLKDGQHVVTKPSSEINIDEMVTFMTGRKIVDMYPSKPASYNVYANDIILQARGLCSTHLKDITFDLYHSEVLGIGGLQGQGQNELMELLFGATPLLSGELSVNGHRFTRLKPIELIKNNVAYIPSERKTEGLYLPFSIKDNISSISYDKVAHGLVGTISTKKETELANNSIQSLRIKCTNVKQIVKSLSGGNQQKVVLGKWLERKPTIMLLNEPTRGIDVGTKREIYNIIRHLVQDGVSIIIISSDISEMIGLCDRVIVLYEHRINAVITGKELTEESLVRASVVKGVGRAL